MNCFACLVASLLLSASPQSKANAGDAGLTRDQVHDTVSRNMSAITACYDAGLKTNPILAGTVRTKFEVSKSGRINYAVIEQSDLKNKDVESCITESMKTWVFPKPVSGAAVTASYPFLFKKLKSTKR